MSTPALTPEQERARRNSPLNVTGNALIPIIQHWATMVDEQRQTIDLLRVENDHVIEYNRRLVRRIDALSGLLTDLNQQLNEAAAQNVQMEVTGEQLVDIICRIVRENPVLREQYREEFFLAVAGFTPENPIDLTAMEEIDEEL